MIWPWIFFVGGTISTVAHYKLSSGQDRTLGTAVSALIAAGGGLAILFGLPLS